MPEPRELHIDRQLTNLSLQYRNEEMIWREVMPVVPVGKRSDKYYKYAKENAYRKENDRVGPKSQANELDWELSTDNYSVKDHALADWVPVEAQDNADVPIQMDVDTNEFLNMVLDVNQEERVKDIVFSAATYPAGNKVTLSGTSQWGQSADDPIGDLQTAIETCFMRANTLVFGLETWLVFRKLPEVLDAVKAVTRFSGASPGGLASMSEVAALFEVQRVLVGRARYITSKEGQSPNFARLWGKHCAALHVRPGVSIKTLTFGMTFVEQPRLTQRMFDPKRGVKGADYVKVGWNSDEKVVAGDLGYFVENAVA